MARGPKRAADHDPAIGLYQQGRGGAGGPRHRVGVGAKETGVEGAGGREPHQIAIGRPVWPNGVEGPGEHDFAVGLQSQRRGRVGGGKGRVRAAPGREPRQPAAGAGQHLAVGLQGEAGDRGGQHPGGRHKGGVGGAGGREAGQAVHGLAVQLGEVAAQQQLAVGLAGQHGHAAGHLQLGGEGRVGGASADELPQRRFDAVEGVEETAHQHAAVGLQADGGGRVAGSGGRAHLEGEVLRTVGVEAGYAVGAGRHEEAHHQNLAIGLEHHGVVVVAAHVRSEVGRGREPGVEGPGGQQAEQPDVGAASRLEVAAGQYAAVGLHRQALHLRAGRQRRAERGVEGAVGVQAHQPWGRLPGEGFEVATHQDFAAGQHRHRVGIVVVGAVDVDARAHRKAGVHAAVGVEAHHGRRRRVVERVENARHQNFAVGLHRVALAVAVAADGIGPAAGVERRVAGAVGVQAEQLGAANTAGREGAAVAAQQVLAGGQRLDLVDVALGAGVLGERHVEGPGGVEPHQVAHGCAVDAREEPGHQALAIGLLRPQRVRGARCVQAGGRAKGGVEGLGRGGLGHERGQQQARAKESK